MSSVSSASPLPALITERLLLARDVAWTKFHSGAAVYDPVREAAILADLVALGQARGLDASRVEAFFTAQIAASREVQTELLAAWANGSALRPASLPLDLRTEIRPRLDALTPRLLDALAELPVSVESVNNAGVGTATAATLRAAGFSPAVIALAVAPLRP